MIQLTRLNHVPLVLNSDLIEHIEVTPDTVIMLTTGQIIRVIESADEVVARVVEFRRCIWRGLFRCPFPAQAADAAGGAGRAPGDE
jgi:flagellar protein FlbD